MAKTSTREKHERRRRMAEHYRQRNLELRALRKKGTEEEVIEAQEKLDKRPRDKSEIRIRRRCNSCGRPRGVMRRFGLCRLCLRKLLSKGLIPGLRKASW